SRTMATHTLGWCDAVGEMVRRQTEVGVDVITDGEQGKASFFGYIVERFTGFERQAAPAGQEGSTRAGSREDLDFPDYYAWSERIADRGRGNTRKFGVDVCTGPVSYRGQAAVQFDIDALRAAVGSPALRSASASSASICSATRCATRSTRSCAGG